MDALRSTLARLPAALLLSASLQSAANAQSSPEIKFNDGLLSVNASNVPVMQLADALSREMGIAVIVQGDTKAAISAEFSEETVDKAIAKLSPNHMLVHASKALNADILEVVLIIAEGGAQATSGGEFLPTGAPADEIAIAQPAPMSAAASPVSAAASPEDAAAITDDGTNGQLRDKMRKLNARIVGASEPATSTAPETQQQ